MIEYPRITSMDECGVCALVYGPPGSGKTYSALTLPEPILLLNREAKGPQTVHGIEHGKDIDYREPESWDDSMQYLNDLIAQAKDGKLKYKAVFNDGLTFTNTLYKQALEDGRYDARQASRDEKKSKVKRPDVLDRCRIELQDYGSLASMMSRETYLLNKLSKFGVVVVSTAISCEYPKWDQSVRMGPSLIGQEYPKILVGFFDYVGFIVKPFQYDEQGKPILPMISFNPKEIDMGLSYLARCSSTQLAEMEAKYGPAPLNWSKLLKVIRGK